MRTLAQRRFKRGDQLALVEITDNIEWFLEGKRGEYIIILDRYLINILNLACNQTDDM